jgi:alpha-L-fucosidase
MSAKPSDAQQRYLDLRLGMMLHFGINTYYGREWSDGSLDPARFDPDKLDTDAWCESACAAGMKLVTLTTKHHDGFCLWPSAQTNYTTMASPCRRDIVGELAESCRKFGLRLALYYSLWDRHQDAGDDAAYADFMLLQLEELFTRYGDITMLWLDGVWFKLAGRVPSLDEMENIHNIFPGAKLEEFLAAWHTTGRQRWHFDRLYSQVKSWQPDCLVMNNTTTEFPGIPLFPVDARCGEKATALGGDRKVWEFEGREVYLPLQIETTLSQKGPPGPFANGGWFWHEGDHSCATLDQLAAWKRKASELDAVLLLNSGVMASGEIRPEEQAIHKSIGRLTADHGRVLE